MRLMMPTVQSMLKIRAADDQSDSRILMIVMIIKKKHFNLIVYLH